MSDGLKRLLETEAELDELLDATKRRAAELVEAARVEAQSRARRHERELEKEQGDLKARLEAECETSIRDVADRAAEEVKRLDALSDQAIVELAEHVLEKLVGGSSGGTS
jgi:vacuolar-type H+-ATPase subunit H